MLKIDMATTYMTAEGLQKLKEELQYLESVERPRVIAAIAEAREKGDLSENAEYDAAKEEQGILESKIAMIKGKIVDARIIDETDINTDEVQILTKVRVLNLKTNQEKVYQLVTEGEANILEGKIATTTPIAKGLMGKKVGDTAEVVVPAGKLQFKVLEISI
jgi:transcription elongation factor GreA